MTILNRAARIHMFWALAFLYVGTARAQHIAAEVPVQPGDRFVIRFLAEAAPADTVIIDNRLEIALPFAGRISLKALTANIAEDSVRARLLAFRREGAVSVTFERRIAVLGDVRRPNIYYMDMTVRLRAALAMAGGVAESGQTREVLLLRDGVQTRLLNWRTSEVGDMELRSGDELVVPRESWFKRNASTVVAGFSVVASIVVAILLR